MSARSGFAAVAAAAALLAAPAHAQDDLGNDTGFDLLPAPDDNMFGDQQGVAGACGRDVLGPVDAEVQAIHARQGECDRYRSDKFRDFYLAMAKIDRREGRPRGGDEVSGYETVANYFNFHGEDWWDGRTSRGYRETAALAGQALPGVTTLYGGGRGATLDPRASAAQAAPAGDGDHGACGFPIDHSWQVADQNLLAQVGRCHEYKGRRE